MSEQKLIDYPNYPFESDKCTLESNGSFTLYKRRFLVLFVLALALFINGEVWMTFGTVFQQSGLYFNATAAQVNFFATIFLIAYATAAVPCIFIPQLIGCKYTLISGCALNFFGTVFRVLIFFVKIPALRFYVLLFNNCLFGFSMAFLFSLPTLISSVWFGENERSLSTSVPFMMNCLGVGVGYLDIFLIMPSTPDVNIINQRFLIIFLFEFILSFICFVLSFIFVREKPPFPPSWAEKNRIKRPFNTFNQYFFQTTKLAVRVFFKPGAIVAFLVFTFNYGCYMIMYTVLSEIIVKYVVVKEKENFSGYTGSIGVIIGGCFCILTGYLMEKTRNNHNNYIGMFANIFCGLPLAVVLILIHHNNLQIWSSILFFIIYLCFCPIYMTIGSEILAEISHPIDPNISASEAMIFGNLFGAISSNLLGLISEDIRYYWCIGLCIFLYSINVLLLIKKFKKNR